MNTTSKKNLKLNRLDSSKILKEVLRHCRKCLIKYNLNTDNDSEQMGRNSNQRSPPSIKTLMTKRLKQKRSLPSVKTLAQVLQ